MERSSEPGLASEDAIDMPMYTRKTPPGLTCALLVVVVSLCAGILFVGGLYAKQQDLAARTKENQQAICDTTHCRAHGACRLNPSSILLSGIGIEKLLPRPIRARHALPS